MGREGEREGREGKEREGKGKKEGREKRGKGEGRGRKLLPPLFG